MLSEMRSVLLISSAPYHHSRSRFGITPRTPSCIFHHLPLELLAYSRELVRVVPTIVQELLQLILQWSVLISFRVLLVAGYRRCELLWWWVAVVQVVGRRM